MVQELAVNIDGVHYDGMIMCSASRTHKSCRTALLQIAHLAI